MSADQTRCQRRGAHDWGTGPGESAPLVEGQVQRCVDCRITRRLGAKGSGLVYGR